MQVREAVTSLAASVDGNEFVLSGISLRTTLTAGQRTSFAGHVQTGGSRPGDLMVWTKLQSAPNRTIARHDRFGILQSPMVRTLDVHTSRSPCNSRWDRVTGSRDSR
jgi:hypothetical protein